MIKKKILIGLGKFDYDTLVSLRDSADFQSLNDVMRTAVSLAFSLHRYAKEGYPEFVARNPDTGEERVLISSEQRKIAG